MLLDNNKTKQRENEKQTFFERLHWVVFQFFIQKYQYKYIIQVCACAYQGVENVSFSENFAYVLYEWPLSQSECRYFYVQVIRVYKGIGECK